MTYAERVEFNLELEDLMDKIEKSDRINHSLTDEQWNTLAAVYYGAEDWKDYWELDNLFNQFFGK